MNRPAVTALALALAAPFFVPAALPAYANSAPACWSGADGAAVSATDGDCPAEVERETLTFEIPSLPQSSYASQEQFDAYDSRVTAEYVFRNPTQSDLALELAFPLGAVPEYLARGGEEGPFDDSARVAVTADGVPSATKLRHTDPAAHGSPVLPADKKGARGVLREDAVCYAFTCEADGESEDLPVIRLAYNPARTRILLGSYGESRVENGDLAIVFSSGAPARFFAVGEKPRIVFAGFRGESAAGAVSTDETEGTFGALVEEARPEGVGETDWYNAFLAYSEETEDSDRGVIYGVPASYPEGRLVRWVTYPLAIPAGGTVVNRVTVPLYPDIAGGSYYRFRYLLSPARGWADFGALRIEIYTPYPVSDPSLDFESTEWGFVCERDGLPVCELDFAIGGTSPGFVGGGGSDRALLIALCTILAGAAVAGIAALVVRLAGKRGGKR